MPNLTEYETVEDNVKTVFLGKYRVSKKNVLENHSMGKFSLIFVYFWSAGKEIRSLEHS